MRAFARGWGVATRAARPVDASRVRCIHATARSQGTTLICSRSSAPVPESQAWISGRVVRFIGTHTHTRTRHYRRRPFKTRQRFQFRTLTPLRRVSCVRMERGGMQGDVGAECVVVVVVVVVMGCVENKTDITIHRGPKPSTHTHCDRSQTHTQSQCQLSRLR